MLRSSIQRSIFLNYAHQQLHYAPRPTMQQRMLLVRPSTFRNAPLTTATSTPSSSNHNKRKRRRPQSRFERLPGRHRLTIREQQRMLVETNRRRTKETLQEQAEAFLDVATGRLGWVRHQLYSYWNPDYDKLADPAATTTLRRPMVPASAADGSTATTATHIAPPPRYKLVMDTRWWIWNIAFALLPAIWIGLYCEFRAQPRMHEFHRLQQITQMRSIKGDAWYEENMKKVMTEKEETSMGSFINRFAASTWELCGLMVQYVMDEIGMGKERENTDATQDDERAMTNDHSSSIQETKPSKNSGDEAPQHESTTVPKESIKSTVPGTTTAAEEPSLQVLLARIEELERQVKAKGSTASSSPSQVKPSANDEEEELKNFQLKSGVRQRLDASLVRQWNEKVEASDKQQEKATEKENETAGITERLQALAKDWGVADILSSSSSSSIESDSSKQATTGAPSLPAISEKDDNGKDISGDDQMTGDATRDPSTNNGETVRHEDVSRKQDQPQENKDVEQQQQRTQPWWRRIWRKN